MRPKRRQPITTLGADDSDRLFKQCLEVIRKGGFMAHVEVMFAKVLDKSTSQMVASITIRAKIPYSAIVSPATHRQQSEIRTLVKRLQDEIGVLAQGAPCQLADALSQKSVRKVQLQVIDNGKKIGNFSKPELIAEYSMPT